MYPSLINYNVLHEGDVLIKPIENKVVVNGIITTTNPSIIQHRADKGEVIKIGTSTKFNDSNIKIGDIIRFNIVYGIDIMFNEGHYILLSIDKIICKETNTKTNTKGST